MALPAKTSIRVDALLEATQRNLEAAKQNEYSSDVVDTVVTCLLEGLSCTLLNQQQQQQIQNVLALWKECGNRSTLSRSPWPAIEAAQPGANNHQLKPSGTF